MVREYMPRCFRSNPSPQAQAENDCDGCEVKNECSPPAKKPVSDRNVVDMVDNEENCRLNTTSPANIAPVKKLVDAINGLKKISTVIYAENIIDGRVVDRTTIGDLYETQFLDVEDALTEAQAWLERQESKSSEQPVEWSVTPEIAEGGLAEIESDLCEYLEGYDKLSKYECRSWAAQIMNSVIRPHLRPSERESVERQGKCGEGESELIDAVVRLNKSLDAYWNGNRTDHHVLQITDAQWRCKDALLKMQPTTSQQEARE